MPPLGNNHQQQLPIQDRNIFGYREPPSSPAAVTHFPYFIFLLLLVRPTTHGIQKERERDTHTHNSSRHMGNCRNSINYRAKHNSNDDACPHRLGWMELLDGFCVRTFLVIFEAKGLHFNHVKPEQCPIRWKYC